MKTETYPEEANLTTGQILRQAREKLELSQQTVADRLCLKLSTVRDIEEDNTPSNITLTFFRGYIRAYAKLVQVPESEILSILDKQMPAKTMKVSPMQSFSSRKKRKKSDGWLMKITWAIIILLLGMTGLWWWQNYKVQQKELSSMAAQSSVQSAHVQGAENSPAASTAIADNKIADNKIANNVSAPLKENQSAAVSQEKASPEQVNGTGIKNSASTASNTQMSMATEPKTVPNPAAANETSENPSVTTNTGTENPVVSTSSIDVNNISAISSNELVMDFNGECWLEIKDAKGKILFSGTKKKGDNLKLSGVLPYSLNIGAPSQVKVQFQGKPVDLNSFIKKGVTAKLKLK
ncbi:cytoskeleton protein RodZ [Xenorhabdus miraniensis]|uniref:Cytoskeletal protein RodZ n=1 Tax=Xenorhabdus miraniensis TaxID=351674 RepID=A0A2D0JKM2_9GAMM|nr:cytoskeleton protein RodZ [Xenorhabdus miraniensis]PHM46699.1 cytoskeletal protein RodZ [Xenorhabdus miraniensis]